MPYLLEADRYSCTSNRVNEVHVHKKKTNPDTSSGQQQLQEMIEELHKNQVSVYLDAVMNHKAGADYTEFPGFTKRQGLRFTGTVHRHPGQRSS